MNRRVVVGFVLSGGTRLYGVPTRAYPNDETWELIERDGGSLGQDGRIGMVSEPRVTVDVSQIQAVIVR